MFEDFTLKIKNITKDKAGKEEVKTLRKSIFEVAEAVEKFALNFSKRHQSGMKPSERIVSPKMGEVSWLVSKSIPLLLTNLLSDLMSCLIPYS